MAVTTRGDKPAAADAILFAPSSTNISKPTTELQDSGYATQARPGSANYNWLFNYVSAGIAHEFVYGIAEYDSGETYVANSYTNRLGLIYRSRTGGNIGNVPESSPDEWHDIRTPLEFAISATETHNPQSLFDEKISIDTSGGDVSVTIGPGLYIGQIITSINEGSGIATISATGIVSNTKVGEEGADLKWIGSRWAISFHAPQIGSTYIQFPGDSDPATLGFPGTWSNVSSELAGDFIRFEGGNALAFEAGQQSDAMQRITGAIGTGESRYQNYSGTGVFAATGTGSRSTSGTNVAAANGDGLDFDSANSTSPNAAKTDDVETRAVNRTVRKWRRTA